MELPLYKLYKRSSPDPESISGAMALYEKTYPQYYQPARKVLTSDSVGIEIEIEKITHHGPIQYPVWQVKGDNSLRDSGYEFVSHPIAGKRIGYALNQFFALVSPGYHFSPRTSIHVHLNVLDMTPSQIAILAMTFCAFERILYEWVGHDRDKNNFCVPYYESKAYGILKPFMTTPFMAPQLDGYRYLGMNLDSVRKFGTVEFRQLAGTDDIERIITWINLIFCLKKYALANSLDTVKGKIDRLNTTSAYDEWYREVFADVPGQLDWSMLQLKMENPISMMKTLTGKNQFYDEIRTGLTKNDWWYDSLNTQLKTTKKPKERDFFEMHIDPEPRQVLRAPPPARARREARVENIIQGAADIGGIFNAIREAEERARDFENHARRFDVGEEDD